MRPVGGTIGRYTRAAPSRPVLHRPDGDDLISGFLALKPVSAENNRGPSGNAAPVFLPLVPRVILPELELLFSPGYLPETSRRMALVRRRRSGRAIDRFLCLPKL